MPNSFFGGDVFMNLLGAQCVFTFFFGLNYDNCSVNEGAIVSRTNDFQLLLLTKKGASGIWTTKPANTKATCGKPALRYPLK